MVSEPGPTPPPLPRPTTDRHWRDVLADRWDTFVDRHRDATTEMPRRIVAGVLVVVVVLTVVGVFALRRGDTPTFDAETLPVLESVPAAVSPDRPEVVLVHVAGAVHDPGVYEVAAGARAIDAVAAAGGPTAEAELDRLNLAAPVVDGDRLYVPAMGEDEPPPVNPPAAELPGGRGGLIDLNRATAQELESLPGIGPALAAGIVAHRLEHGPFSDVAQLVDVPGIGPAKFDRLADLITVT